MKKPVLFTMKMKNEKEREAWQKYAKDRYGEPLSVVIRRLVEEDMRGIRPIASSRIDDLLKSIQKENYQYYKDLLNRIIIVNEYLSSPVRDITIQLDILRGLLFQKLDEFYEKHREKVCTLESINNLKEDISELFQEI